MKYKASLEDEQGNYLDFIFDPGIPDEIEILIRHPVKGLKDVYTFDKKDVHELTAWLNKIVFDFMK